MHAEIDRKIDFVNNARFSSRDYDQAINEAIEQIVNDRTDNIKINKRYSLEAVQRVRDELYTIVDSSDLTVAGDIGAFPAGYKHFMKMTSVVNGVTQPVRPTTHDHIEEVLRNSFTKPDATHVFCVQESSGFKVYYDSTNNTLGIVNLVFLKHPATASRGLPDEEISAGAGVLTPASSYIVTDDETIENGVTYYKGEIFSAGTANLTAGKVVLRSNTTDSDLPGTIHKEIIDKAAAIMEGWVDEFQSKQSLTVDASQS